MLVVDAVAQILKNEGVEYLNCYPSTLLIEASVKVGIRPIVCRQERVGVGIADGFARVRNGRSPSVFAMQHGLGAKMLFREFRPHFLIRPQFYSYRWGTLKIGTEYFRYLARCAPTDP